MDGDIRTDRPSSDIGFSPTVKTIQTEKGSRANYERMEASGGWDTTVSPRLSGFLEDLDMFYLGTSNADGQPYIQYRGGPRGFLKVLDDRTLAFADFGGNRQYISVGNLRDNPKAFLFLMDYANSRRIKVWGQAHVVEGDRELLDQLSDPDYPAAVERAIVFRIEAWDVNCPQHIHQRVLVSEVAPVIEALQDRVRELEERLGESVTDPLPGVLTQP